MELKQSSEVKRRFSVFCLNRTSMELKPSACFLAVSFAFCLNRTSMELKPLIVVDDEVWGLFESHLYGIETHLDGEANGGELGV